MDPLLPLLERLERRRWGAFCVQGLLLLNYATDEGCFPIDFQLYLPQA